MNWVAILLLGLAGFFGGGAWTFRENRGLPFWILVALAVLCLAGGALYAWSP